MGSTPTPGTKDMNLSLKNPLNFIALVLMPLTIVGLITAILLISPNPKSADTKTGTLTGKVTIGPICPVERVGVPCPVPPEAYASREIGAYQSDTLIAQTHADPTGSYVMTLPAGTYKIQTLKTGMGQMSKDLPATIEIRANQTTTLNIDIDTGIR